MADSSPDYDQLYEAAGRAWNVDPALLKSVKQQESGLNANPGAVSRTGARGDMQFMPGTAARIGVNNPTDPAQAIFGAAKLLRQNLDRYGSVDGALRAYNAGGPQNWNNPETAAYVPGVAKHLATVNAQRQAASSTDDVLNDFVSGGSAAPSVPKAAASAQSNNSTDDILKDFVGAPEPDSTPQAAVAAQPAQPGARPVATSGVGKFAAGVTQGARDIVQSGAQFGASVDANHPWLAWLDQHNPLIGDPNALVNQLATQKQQFQQQYGDSTAATIGRAYGNIGTAGPLMEGAGAALGAIAGSAAGAAGGAATGLGRGIQAGADMLGGGATAPGVANPLVQGTSLAIRGAGEGAAYNAATGDGSLADRLQQGGAAGAIAGPVLGLVGAGANAAAAMARPFTSAGRSAIAENALSRLAAGGPTAGNAAEIIPGSVPTLAQATGNAGIAAAERVVSGSPLYAQQFLQRAQSNSAARDVVKSAITGDSNALQNLIDARAAQAMPSAALAGAAPVNSAPVVQTIDSILASPSGQRDTVVRALGNIRNKLVQDVQLPNGAMAQKLETDPAQLYGIRQAIGDMLNPLSQGTKSDSRLAAKELKEVQSALDPVIEDGGPGFQNALAGYAQASKPIDAMRYLQNLNLTDASGNITLQKVDTAIKGIQRQQALSGPRDAKSITPDQMNALMGLRSDLQRQAQSRAGMAAGSPTFQNLATQHVLENMGVAPAMMMHAMGATPGLNLLASGVRGLYAGQNQAVMDALANRLLNPTGLAAQGAATSQLVPALAPYAAPVALQIQQRGGAQR